MYFDPNLVEYFQFSQSFTLAFQKIFSAYGIQKIFLPRSKTFRMHLGKFKLPFPEHFRFCRTKSHSIYLLSGQVAYKVHARLLNVVNVFFVTKIRDKTGISPRAQDHKQDEHGDEKTLDKYNKQP